jgi:hypothetical protein
MKVGKKSGFLAACCVVALLSVLLVLRKHSSAPVVLNARAEDLKATIVSASLDVPIASGTNLLWCGTFQLAWNEAAEFLGEDIQFKEDAPLVAALNRKEFTKDALDEASYVVGGGFPTSDSLARIRTDLRQKFGAGLEPQLLPQTNSDLVLFFYACLLKDLAFEKHFQRIEHPLVFGTNSVAAFGIERHYPDPRPLWQQVIVRDYRNTNNFVIELQTKSSADQLILAKVPANGTLADIVKEVCQRAMLIPTNRIEFLRLLVPKTDFSLRRTYTEILGKHLVLKKTAKWNDLPIVAAEQITRFRLDEKGALLKSESSIAAAESSPAVEMAELVFDQPFLVLLQRVGAKVPYFALWVDNAELLVPWDSDSATH